MFSLNSKFSLDYALPRSYIVMKFGTLLGWLCPLKIKTKRKNAFIAKVTKKKAIGGGVAVAWVISVQY